MDKRYKDRKSTYKSDTGEQPQEILKSKIYFLTPHKKTEEGFL